MADADVARQCQWCSTSVAAEMKLCPQCGARLTLRETIGDLVIPGVTHVDPVLARHANDPLRVRGNSPSQSLAGPAVGAAAAAGGPVGLAALGGLTAVAAAEYLSAGGSEARRGPIGKLGQPDEVVLRMLDKIEREEQAAASQQSKPGEEPEPGHDAPPEAPGNS